MSISRTGGRRRAVVVTAIATVLAATTIVFPDAGRASAEANGRDIFNDRIAVSVGEQGEFSVGAQPSPADGTAVANQSWTITYFWPGSSTSFTTLRVDGVDIELKLETPIAPAAAVDQATNRTVWTVGDIRVTQTLQIVPNTQTGNNDVVQVTYVVANIGGTAHQVGLRVMIDTDVNQNDLAPFRVPGNPPITTETDFGPGQIPASIDVFDQITDLVHVASIQPLVGVTSPDRFALASWPGIHLTAWDYAVTPGLELGDSAYALWWNPRSLAPGQSFTASSAIGLGGAVGNQLPPLTAVLSGPARLDFVNGTYQPNPFAIQAIVRNDGNVNVTQANVTLNLPPQLHLVPGAGNTASRALGTVAPGQEIQLSWQVTADLQQFDVTVPYSIDVTSSNLGSKNLARTLVLSGTPGEYIPLNPVRMLDTRLGQGAPKAPIGGRGTVAFQVAGVNGIPAAARAVVLNVTGIGPSAGTFLTVWPSGDTQPPTSNLNLVPGEVAPNLAIVKIGADGKVAIYNDSGAIDIAADALGYFLDPAIALGTGGKQHGLLPTRVVDTRLGQGAPKAPIATDGILSFQATGVGGVPSFATSVILNLTGIAPAGTGGYLTVWPTGEIQPVASNLNLVPGQVRPNLVIAKVGAAGKVSVYNQAGPVDIAVDVLGYFSKQVSEPGSGQVGIVPQRALDTRRGIGTGGAIAKVGAGQSISVRIAGLGAVPNYASSVVLNVTAVGATQSSFVTVWPTGEVRPLASNLNPSDPNPIPNHVIAKIGAGGAVSLYNDTGETDLIIDVMGYFA